jgi:hypothetical protein
MSLGKNFFVISTGLSAELFKAEGRNLSLDPDYSVAPPFRDDFIKYLNNLFLFGKTEFCKNEK